ncbi:sulfatase family protein [Paramicrobacterium chengjingii]|uniref:Sulfatase-like hydrolase/transferase n=1 Tax=Paramicrobacterium chengjingii TaxID=2769067 RepID=A0ABX6YHF7_9MICO|nr:sulfatase-like hydrolase/transferase [Microbacterium chengjingii]QPZ38029.1 sulfatase-like hydrolase/transferase [Microbacterium chengjingii]
MTSTTPNILLIVSDDHGYADRSALGSPDVSTPNLDRLSAEGTSFTDAYVTAPICSPSRAAMITGQYQQRWGATWFDTSGIGGAPTIAERLSNEGYATGYFGKVHYGDEGPGDRGTPPKHGFQESFYGLAGQSMGRLHYLRHSEAAVSEYGQAAEAMAVQPLWSGDEPIQTDTFLTDEIAGRARDFMQRNQEKPFFAMVAFNAVHNFCWQLPAEELERRGLPAFDDWHPGASEYLDWYDGAISPNLPNGREYYLAQLELMDAQVGTLLDELERLGIADDTIVVYLTDNGGSTCNYGDNGELRGTKYTVWEGGVRVPFIVRWSGVAEAGGTNSELTSSLDLAATFAAAAGAEADGTLDGRDLRTVLSSGPGHDELHWDCGWQWAVRHGSWKLSWCDASSPTAEYVTTVEHTTPGDGFFLCDLANDRGERTNLAGQHPAIVDRLVRAHSEWRAEVGLTVLPAS